ncbi:MAG: hypothetical protein HY262_01670 [Chloroflexi bacterium]|nr:hypothetical protein [Chloroflexota bacterium]
MLIGAVAACGGGTANGGPSSAPGATQSTATGGALSGACGTTDPTSIIRTAVKAQSEATSYESVSSSELSGGGTSQMLIDFQSPSSILMKLTSASGTTTERIQVGSKGWMKVGSSWVEAPAIDVSSILANAGGFADSVVFSDVAKVGEDPIEGDAATRYTFSADLGELGTTAGTIWIRDADCLPVKQDSTSSITVAGKAQSAHVVVTISRYGQVTVKAPA